ncbi:GNAT family N-acetyltransferase [Novispirillum sp. DQ9]|uniref:GNAT family N-acetyltransferase n=1 Tax=Novispirillum sp. DQ9 TaxID=3398612 RepID=UPI003C7D706B
MTKSAAPLVRAPIVRARAVAPGRLVRVRAGDLPEPPPGVDADAILLGMKTIRHGKGFITHYLLPLDGRVAAPEDTMLLALDTDTPMTVAGPELRLDLTPVAVAAPACGQVLENASGRFIKVRETYKDAFSLAYVEITAGDIRRRQDRGITAVYDWAIVGSEDVSAPAPPSPAEPAAPVIVRETRAPVQAIRAMTVRDVEAAAELLIAREVPAGKRPEARLRELLTSPLALCHVAEVDDAVAGVVVAQYDGFHVHLSMVAVDARHDRQGIGRALVEAVAEAALARGALGVLADAGLAAAPFLAANGFRLADGLRLRRDVG